jgi:hypothetical protein
MTRAKMPLERIAKECVGGKKRAKMGLGVGLV